MYPLFVSARVSRSPPPCAAAPLLRAAEQQLDRREVSRYRRVEQRRASVVRRDAGVGAGVEEAFDERRTPAERREVNRELRPVVDAQVDIRAALEQELAHGVESSVGRHRQRGGTAFMLGVDVRASVQQQSLKTSR